MAQARGRQPRKVVVLLRQSLEPEHAALQEAVEAARAGAHRVGGRGAPGQPVDMRRIQVQLSKVNRTALGVRAIALAGRYDPHLTRHRRIMNRAAAFELRFQAMDRAAQMDDHGVHVALDAPDGSSVDVLRGGKETHRRPSALGDNPPGGLIGSYFRRGQSR